MNPPAGDDRPTEPTHTYVPRDPSPDTIKDTDQLVRAIVEGVEEGRVDPVPVLLLPDRPEFERALLAYGLMDADSLGAFLKAFPEAERPNDALRLARALVQAGILTRYQASAVLQGKAKVLAIGPYLVLDRLGSGGMGLVFKARHRDSGDVVALKLLPPSASKQEQAVLRFRREAKIMAQLDHGNLVSCRDIGEHNGVHYLVMDYVEGLDLHRIVKADGPLGVRQAVDCIIQAARGLAAAHERGIVHRDIKPANLIASADGTVRVLDLGLARITQAADPLQAREADPSLTHSGMIMGTVDFLPPEQSNNSKLADHRADIYSLGCTMYYLLTGRPPFAGETIMERLIAHHQKPVPSLREFRSDVPTSLDAAFRRMLEKEPGRRFQSMAEVIQALDALLDSGQPWGEAPVSDPSALLSAGRVAADRMPEGSDLSGYEILTDSQSKLWSPLLDPPSEEVPRAIDRTSKKSATSKSAGPGPSTQRRWIGLALLALLILGVVMVVMEAVRSIFRGLGPSIP